MYLLDILGDEQFLWTFVVAAVCSLSCSMLGCYLVLKRMSLLGDAINHGVLPGIALAVLWSGQITSYYLFFGAMVFGLLTALLSQTLHAVGGVSEDSSLGVVFTSFFALGVLLISKFIRGVDLDTECVFLGNLDQVLVRVEEVLPVQLLALAVTLSFVVLFWKEMKVAIFDAELATAMGFSAILLHYTLVVLVAGVAVTSFEAVGSILVLAMLIVPGATAHLLTDRLDRMFLLAGTCALLSAFFGCVLSFYCNTNSAGMLAVVAGVLFVAAVIFSPRHGIVARIWRGWQLTLRIAGEDILSALYRAEESNTPLPARLTQPEHGYSQATEKFALWHLRRNGLIVPAAMEWRLTGPGRDRARAVVRAHRLWEAFLEQTFALPLDHLHGPASWMEHFLGPQFQEQLADQLDQPGRDPHGKSIPPAKV